MKFSIKDFFSKCDQIHRKLRISNNHFSMKLSFKALEDPFLIEKIV